MGVHRGIKVVGMDGTGTVSVWFVWSFWLGGGGRVGSFGKFGD